MVIMVISESSIYQSEQVFLGLSKINFGLHKDKIPFSATHININC